ncbi:hypothetical protein SOASR031_00390 [Leminorella grimontii]|nr:hypothetical protein SOASR031_00390 [Leminorella grimontii]
MLADKVDSARRLNAQGRGKAKGILKQGPGAGNERVHDKLLIHCSLSSVASEISQFFVLINGIAGWVLLKLF